MEALGIQTVERIKRSRPGGIYDEVKVTFGEAVDRDSVAYKGNMLSEFVDKDGRPTAGIRLDIPDYLAGDFKTLTDYGIRMRHLHGKTTRRYIKYDEDNYTIYLELRLPHGRSYLKITPDLAKRMREEDDREEIQSARDSLRGRPRLSAPESISANHTPLSNAPFVVPQRPRSESSNPALAFERINDGLRREAMGPTGWRPRNAKTSGLMDDIEPAEVGSEDEDGGRQESTNAFTWKPQPATR